MKNTEKRNRKNEYVKTQLAEKLNVHRTTIGKYERGEAINIPVLIQYSEVFGK